MTSKVIEIRYPLLLSATVFLLLTIFFLTSCAGKKSLPISKVTEIPSANSSNTETRLAWEQEWERTIREAKKEGTVVIHLGSGISTSLRQEISKIMKSKYNLELEIVAGRATELAEKIIREHKAGLYLADIYIAGATTAILRIKPGGVLDPVEPMFILPEVKDGKLWLEGKLPFVDKEKLILAFSAYPNTGLSYNADYVSKEDLQSYRDLLNPRWKGKIVMSDPSIGGSGNSWFYAIGLKVMGTEYLKELAKQDISFTRDLRLMVEWMARGKHVLGIGAGGAVLEMQRAGVPLYLHTPKEGDYLTSGWGNLALYKHTPHPNATRIFINWLLSKEGQTVFSRGQDTQSARVDVPTDFISPDAVRKPGLSYFNSTTEDAEAEKSPAMQIAREIFNIK